MEWIFGIVVAAAILYLYLRAGGTKCPNCGEDTIEVGYEGYKRKCQSCKWRN